MGADSWSPEPHDTRIFSPRYKREKAKDRQVSTRSTKEACDDGVPRVRFLPRLEAAIERARREGHEPTDLRICPPDAERLAADLGVEVVPPGVLGLRVAVEFNQNWLSARATGMGWPVESYPDISVHSDLYCPKCGEKGQLVDEGGHGDYYCGTSIICGKCMSMFYSVGLLPMKPRDNYQAEIVSAARERGLLP